MFQISAQTWTNNSINIRKIRNKENKLLEVWLKMTDIQKILGVKNMSDLVIKEIEGIIIETEMILQIKKRKNIKSGLMMDMCTLLVILL